jgi:hypothetical protein
MSSCQLARPMTGFEPRRVSSVAATPIQGQLSVRALNDGFTALNSVAAMSQSGRYAPDRSPDTGQSAIRPRIAGRDPELTSVTVRYPASAFANQ